MKNPKEASGTYVRVSPPVIEPVPLRISSSQSHTTFFYGEFNVILPWMLSNLSSDILTFSFNLSPPCVVSSSNYNPFYEHNLWRSFVYSKRRTSIVRLFVVYLFFILSHIWWVYVTYKSRRILDWWADLLHTYTPCYYTSQTTIWHTMSPLLQHFRIPQPSSRFESQSRLLNDGQFTTNQFVLATNATETTSNYFPTEALQS
jgi:hypothetical protein